MGVLVVLADLVIDGTGRAPIEGGAVRIEDGRIAAVGRRADVAVPEGAEVIERPGETLLPGLVDAHTHVSIIPGLGKHLSFDEFLFLACQPAIGTGEAAIAPTVCAFQAIVPKTTDWREHQVRPVLPDGQERPELEPSYSVKA